MYQTTSHRRDFVRTLALGASAGLVAGSGAAAARRADDETTGPSDDPTPPKSDQAATETVDPDDADIDARMDLILARYGDRLDDDARASVRREVAGIVRRAKSLRRFPLDNGDGPATVWVPFRPLA